MTSVWPVSFDLDPDPFKCTKVKHQDVLWRINMGKNPFKWILWTDTLKVDFPIDLTWDPLERPPKSPYILLTNHNNHKMHSSWPEIEDWRHYECDETDEGRSNHHIKPKICFGPSIYYFGWCNEPSQHRLDRRFKWYENHPKIMCKQWHWSMGADELGKLLTEHCLYRYYIKKPNICKIHIKSLF